jgi:hypothetical protein
MSSLRGSFMGSAILMLGEGPASWPQAGGRMGASGRGQGMQRQTVHNTEASLVSVIWALQQLQSGKGRHTCDLGWKKPSFWSTSWCTLLFQIVILILESLRLVLSAYSRLKRDRWNPLFLLLLIGPCILNVLVKFIHSKINSVKLMILRAHYNLFFQEPRDKVSLATRQGWKVWSPRIRVQVEEVTGSLKLFSDFHVHAWSCPPCHTHHTLGISPHTFNPSTLEADAGSLRPTWST